MKGWMVLLALGSCANAGAAEWQIVHTNVEGDQYYYDASKLAVSGNELTYWKKVLFKTPQAYRGQQAVSALYRERIHCAEHTVKPLSHVVHAASGMVIEQVNAEGETTAIIPDTIGDLFETVLCRKIGVKRDEAPTKTPDQPEGKMESPILPSLQDYPPGTL